MIVYFDWNIALHVKYIEHHEYLTVESVRIVFLNLIITVFGLGIVWVVEIICKFFKFY